MKASTMFITKSALTLAFASIVSFPGVVIAGDCEQDKAVISTQKMPNGHRWVKAKIFIKASPHVVWDTVHEERKHDPDMAYSKILEHNKNEATLEQKFTLLPVLGTAVCVMKNIETPLQRIDYNMISSDRFKAMEGAWVLTPGTDPNSTYLELATYCDMGIPVPRPMIEGVTAKKLQRRLSNVKNMAEALQTKLAQTHKPD